MPCLLPFADLPAVSIWCVMCHTVISSGSDLSGLLHNAFGSGEVLTQGCETYLGGIIRFFWWNQVISDPTQFMACTHAWLTLKSALHCTDPFEGSYIDPMVWALLLQDEGTVVAKDLSFRLLQHVGVGKWLGPCIGNSLKNRWLLLLVVFSTQKGNFSGSRPCIRGGLLFERVWHRWLRLTPPLQKALVNTIRRGVANAAVGSAAGFLEDSHS